MRTHPPFPPRSFSSTPSLTVILTLWAGLEHDKDETSNQGEEGRPKAKKVKGKKEKKGNRVKRRGREESRFFKPSHPPVPSSFAPKPLLFFGSTTPSDPVLDPRHRSSSHCPSRPHHSPSSPPVEGGFERIRGSRRGTPRPAIGICGLGPPAMDPPPSQGRRSSLQEHQRHSSSPGLGAAILPTHGRGTLGLYETAQ